MKKNTVAEIITSKITDALSKGELPPWKQTWKCFGHRNLVSRKAYKGINPFLLDMRGFRSPFWVTWNQAANLGGKIKVGEEKNYTIVVFFTMKLYKKEQSDGTSKEKKFPMLRYYRLYNLDQTEGLEKHVPADTKREHQPIAEAEAIVKGYQTPPSISHGGDRAYYMPSRDSVQMPVPENFETDENYYSVLFHELGHSTGHFSRLARKDFSEFFVSHEQYAKEELIAEMTAAFLSAECGFTTERNVENSAAYIKGWLKALSNDPTMVVSAASAAQKAADHILGREKDEEAEEDKEEADAVAS